MFNNLDGDVTKSKIICQQARTLRPPPQVYCSLLSTQTNIIIKTV